MVHMGLHGNPADVTMVTMVMSAPSKTHIECFQPNNNTENVFPSAWVSKEELPSSLSVYYSKWMTLSESRDLKKIWESINEDTEKGVETSEAPSFLQNYFCWWMQR